MHMFWYFRCTEIHSADKKVMIIYKILLFSPHKRHCSSFLTWCHYHHFSGCHVTFILWLGTRIHPARTHSYISHLHFVIWQMLLSEATPKELCYKLSSMSAMRKRILHSTVRWRKYGGGLVFMVFLGKKQTKQILNLLPCLTDLWQRHCVCTSCARVLGV